MAQLVRFMRSGSSRAVGSFGLAQTLVAASALIRLPIISGAIGSSGLGLIFISGAIIPILLVVAVGLRTASRLLCAEELGRRSIRGASLARHEASSLAWACALCIGAVGLLLSLALPLQGWFGAESVASPAEIHMLFGGSIIMSCLAYPGAVWWGALEGSGFMAVGNMMVVFVTSLGLVATLIIAAMGGGVVELGLVNAATSTMPFVCVAAAAPSLLKWPHWRRSSSDRRRAVRLAVATYSLRGSSEVATRGADPLIIGGFLGPTASATYGVAQRLSAGITMIPTALAPVMATAVSRKRGAGTVLARRDIARQVMGQGILASLLAIAFIVIGPALALRLGAGQDGPLSLYVGLAVVSVLWAVQVPLVAAASSPLALRLGLIVESFGALLNIIGSLVLVRVLGVAGPVWASVMVVASIDLFWILLLIRHRRSYEESHLPVP